MSNFKIPLLSSVAEQKLIITFKKIDTAEGDISFDFEPDFEEAVSPEQRAAVNIAQQIINMLGMQQQENLNGTKLQ